MELVFSPPRIVDRFNLEQLTPMHQQQLLVAGRAAWNEDQLSAILEAGETEQMRWEHYRVSRADDKAVAYDAWILDDDCGTLFLADRLEESGVVMVHSLFELQHGAAADEALVQAVSAAYKRARPEFDGREFDAYWDALYRRLDATEGVSGNDDEDAPRPAAVTDDDDDAMMDASDDASDEVSAGRFAVVPFAHQAQSEQSTKARHPAPAGVQQVKPAREVSSVATKAKTTKKAKAKKPAKKVQAKAKKPAKKPAKKARPTKVKAAKKAKATAKKPAKKAKAKAKKPAKKVMAKMGGGCRC